MTAQVRFSKSDWFWFLAWGLASTLWCVTAARQLGATFDEPIYISRGLEAWRSGGHGGLMELGTMPLAVDLNTLPLYLWERWRGAQFDPPSQMEFLLPWARAGTLLFWWLLLAYGWRAGTQLAGRWGGRLTVALLACEPNLLAHASLATTDIAVAACLLALIYHFRVERESRWIRRIGLPAVWFAASVLAKASGLVFGPLCLLAVEAERLARSVALKSGGLPHEGWVLPRHLLQRLRPFRRDLVQISACGLILVFLYCGSEWRQEPSFVAWAHSLPDGPANRVMVWGAEHLRIFSNAGEGLARQIKHNIRGAGGHWAYLLGGVRRAYWYYFPAALAIKLSLPLLAMAAVLVLIAPRALANWAGCSVLALLAFSPAFRVQIGIRLVLPLVVLLVVGLAAATAGASRDHALKWNSQWLTAAAGAGVVWMVSSAALVWPHGLCYTNELWGGTERGYLRLSDSNYDWGQGLKELARWQQEGRLPRQNPALVDVWYFGTDPSLRRLPLRHLPLHTLPIQDPSDVAAQVRGHYLAVSTTLLYGVAMTDAHQKAAAFLRTLQPVARTTTFFIYDFTREKEPARRTSLFPERRLAIAR